MTLGMDEDVQPNCSTLRCSSLRDLNFGPEGSSKTTSNGISDLKVDSSHNGSLPAPLPGHLLGCSKEQLKLTILKQEAIFKDQVHELHQLYWKQKELMDEVKQNKLSTHTLKLETSGSSSSYVSSQNTQEIFCSPNLPRSTGHSSVLNSKSIQLPFCLVQGKSRQIFHVPPPTAGCSKLSEPKDRTVGKKTLDLELPADEYINSEAGVSLEEDRASNVGPTHNRNAHHLCGRTEFGSQNLSNEIIQNYKKRQNLDAGSDQLVQHQKKKHEWLYSTHAVQSGSVSDSFATAIPIGNLPVLSKSLSKEPKGVNDPSCFPSLSQGMASHGLFQPDCASLAYPPFQLVSKVDMISSGIPPILLQEKPACDIGQSLLAGQPLCCISSSAPFAQSSISLMGMPCLIGDKFDQCKRIKPGSNLDRQNIHLISPCNNELNSCNNHGSSVSNELIKYDKGSEDSGMPKNINLNMMPVDSSDITTSQNILSTDEEKKLKNLRRRMPWFKEPVFKGKLNEESKMPAQMGSALFQPCVSRAMHGFQLKKIEENNLGKEKILAFDINEKSHTSDLDSSPAYYSKASHNPPEGQKIEDTVKDCIPEENPPSNHMHDLGEKVPSGERIVINELVKEHKSLAGEIDLNLCVNDTHSTPTDIDICEPVSPENKECSPPRGESAESQSEMPYQSAGKEGPNAEKDHITIAAEALVSMAAFLANKGLQMTTCSPSESFVANRLHWFAEIVSSEMDDPNEEATVDLSGKADVLEVVLPAGIDFFEAMTLMLIETKDLECCCKNNGQIEEESISAHPTQPKKSPGNKGRWNGDFQSDILPSLTSLSRCEVTEDLQTIGGLMKAAGTTVDTGSLRSAGMILSTRGRKRSCISAFNIPDLQLKQLPGNKRELGIEKRTLVSWGKVGKRRGGQRIPARNLWIF